MKLTLAPLAALAIASAALLSGCSFTGTLSVPADDVATTAEDALEEQVGSRPDLDCGTEDVELIDDTTVDCILTDPETGVQYEAVATIKDVEGGDYTVGIQVADSPINAPSPEPEPEPTIEPDDDDGTPTVPGDDIAALAAGALEAEVGFVPDLRCPEENVSIVVGNRTYCQFYDQDEVSHDVEVEITEFDGSTYTITAVIIS